MIFFLQTTHIGSASPVIVISDTKDRKSLTNFVHKSKRINYILVDIVRQNMINTSGPTTQILLLLHIDLHFIIILNFC